MEQVLASTTTLAGQLLVSTDDGVADGAFCLSFKGSSDVFTPGGKAVDQVSVLQ